MAHSRSWPASPATASFVYLPVAGQHVQLRFLPAVKAFDRCAHPRRVRSPREAERDDYPLAQQQHFWEVGLRGYRPRDIGRRLSAPFEILSAYRNRDWTPSYNFVLRSRSQLPQPHGETFVAPPMNDSSSRRRPSSIGTTAMPRHLVCRLPSSWNVDVRNTQVLLRRHVRPGFNRFLEIGCAPGKMLAWVGRKPAPRWLAWTTRPAAWLSREAFLQKLDIQADLRCEDLAATSFTPTASTSSTAQGSSSTSTTRPKSYSSTSGSPGPAGCRR